MTSKTPRHLAAQNRIKNLRIIIDYHDMHGVQDAGQTIKSCWSQVQVQKRQPIPRCAFSCSLESES